MNRFLLAVAVAHFLTNPAEAAQTYLLTDLGTLGGASSYGTAINDNGTAVGFSALPGGATHAFRWTPGGGIQDIGNLGGEDSRAFDVNNAEHIVGQTTHQAFRWTSSAGMVLMDTGDNHGSGEDLNEASEAVGTRILIGADRTIRWSSTNAITNPFLTSNTRGAALNNNNEFVGTNNFGATGYFSNGGPRTSFSLLPTDLNDSRLIVGAVGDTAAYLDFDSSTTTLIGKLSFTDTFSRALGINAAGTIVGVSQGTGAFIYDSSSGLQSLTSMLDADYSEWTVLVADDINNLGQIVGQGRFNGVDHAVILTPVPEPTAAGFALIAWAFVSVAHNRARR